MTQSTRKQDPHSRNTDRILAELEQSSRPWLKPWSGGDIAKSGQARPLRATQAAAHSEHAVAYLHKLAGTEAIEKAA